MKTITDKNIRFFLKDAKAAARTLIYIVFRYENKRFVASTEQSISPYLWNATDQRAFVDPKTVRSKGDRDANANINAHLDRQRAALVKVLNKLSLAGVVFSNELIKEHFDNELGRVKREKDAPLTFARYLEQFVKDAEEGRRLNSKSQRYAPLTVKAMSRLKGMLERYQTDTRKGIDFKDFTVEYYAEFKVWLTGRGLSYNYIGALLKDLKMMLKQSYNEKLHTNTAFQHQSFRRLVEEVDNVYLSEDELTVLYNLDLTKEPRLDRVRDLFLIGAYTGLRFSDFSELVPENITHDGRILTRKTRKTGERVSIPLNSKVLSTLAKYGGIPPRTITNQKTNKALKDLMQKAGFNEKIEISRTRGGSKEIKYQSKWELVTTHTARRSFATNAYLAGVPPVAIMRFTGHKTESMLLRYIKISSEQNAVSMLDHAHFAR